MGCGLARLNTERSLYNVNPGVDPVDWTIDSFAHTDRLAAEPVHEGVNTFIQCSVYVLLRNTYTLTAYWVSSCFQVYQALDESYLNPTSADPQ